MIPRDYQEEAVRACLHRLETDRATMLVMATGAGKTVTAGLFLAKRRLSGSGKALVIQHTDELITQNSSAIPTISGLRPSIVKAERDDWSGDVVFASIATLARQNRRREMPAFDTLVIDEAHRSAAPTYQTVIEECFGLNDRCKLLGMTATPGRGDGKSLKGTYDSVAYYMPIGDLVRRGILVSPKALTIEVYGGDELRGIDPDSADADARSARIFDTPENSHRIVEEWKRHADGRRTIFFAATISHAESIARAFGSAGVKSDIITGVSTDRSGIIDRFDRGETTVLSNVMVLTEGFDNQPVSCIGVVRLMGHISSFIQAVGRGLRKVDPARYPGIVKTDCVVLDFSGAAARHGTLNMEPELEDEEVVKDDRDADPYKICPECESEVPVGVNPCPICQYEWRRKEGFVDERPFVLSEIELLEHSPFRWNETSADAVVASGFDAWATLVRRGDLWVAVAGFSKSRKDPVVVGVGERAQALASADDFLRANEAGDAAHKSKRWLKSAASYRQLELLIKADASWARRPIPTKYEATCALTWAWNARRINKVAFRNDVLVKENNR